MISVPKYRAYRNKKILDFAKGEPCQLCGRNDGTTVAAHSDLIEDGKGVGIKASDHCIAYLCSGCHLAYDRHEISQEEFHRAMKRTWKIILDNGILS